MRCRFYGLVYKIFLDKLPDEIRIILSQIFVTLIQMQIVAWFIPVFSYIYAAISELFLFAFPKNLQQKSALCNGHALCPTLYQPYCVPSFMFFLII